MYRYHVIILNRFRNVKSSLEKHDVLNSRIYLFHKIIKLYSFDYATIIFVNSSQTLY